MEKNRKLAVLLFAVAMLDSCTGPPVRHSLMDQLRPHYGFYQITLYSWSPRPDEYRFALIPEDQQETFLHRFNRDVYYIKDLEDLRLQLHALPKNSGVAWRNEREYGIVFPPRRTIAKVRRVAADEGIDLQVIPTIYE